MTISSTSTLARYRSDLARRPRLPAEVEHELAARVGGGDREAARRLIEGCLPLVMRVATQYRRWGLPIEDLVQEGNVGLLKAAARFAPERGPRLGVYAEYWIRAEIREYVARHHRVVRLGSTKGERRALRVYRKTREPRAEVLAALSGISTERAAELLPMLMHGEARLDAGEDGASPLERLAHRDPSAEDALGEAEERARLGEAIARALASLSTREADIVRRRLLVEEPETLEGIGVAWGVSKERVRQIEQRALARMREALAQIVGEVGATAGGQGRGSSRRDPSPRRRSSRSSPRR